jgi:argininosuccinate synthase
MGTKIIMPFTGGLQSTVCLHWLCNREHADVTAVILDLGQTQRTLELGENAVHLGARGAHIEDCREEFCRDYAFPVLRASAVYERRYMLSGALARPLIAAVIIRIACEEGYRHVGLGACRYSNDFMRFQANVRALAPDLKIIGPDEVPPLRSRKEAVEYARSQNIVLHEGISPAVSFDTNLWGAATAADPKFGTWEQLPEEFYRITTHPKDAPSTAETLTIEFKSGTPVSIDGKELPPHELVSRLNNTAGKHGIGRTEVIEDRLAGIKTREIYEAPAACALMEAHSALEELTLPLQTLQVKAQLARRYAELVYGGEWFSPLRRAMDAFVDVTQESVTGKIRLELFRGQANVVGRESPASLFSSSFAQEHMHDSDGLLPGIFLGQAGSDRMGPFGQSRGQD